MPVLIVSINTYGKLLFLRICRLFMRRIENPCSFAICYSPERLWRTELSGRLDISVRQPAYGKRRCRYICG
jgi:hypothetical protein